MQIDYSDNPEPTVAQPLKVGKKFPFLRGPVYHAGKEGLPDPIWKRLGGWNPQINDSNRYCASILLQEVMETKAHEPEQLAVKHHEQPVIMGETNPGHCMETIHEGEEYQITKDILKMFKT